jgi:hypothetical protein
MASESAVSCGVSRPHPRLLVGLEERAPLRSKSHPDQLAVKLAVKKTPKWSFGGRFEYVAS